MPFKDISGQKFNKLTAIKLYGRKNRITYWQCQCECGNFVIVPLDHLRSGHTKSCGCLQKEKVGSLNFIDVTDKKFGLLTVLEKTNERSSHGNVIWKCKCDCGNISYKDSYYLRYTEYPSCGCIHSKGEAKIMLILDNSNIKFYTQYTYKDCLSLKGYKLKFDFYLPDYNCCIEYDGIQHFEESNFYSHDNFIDREQNDVIKNEYCIKNHISLIRIPYIDYDKINWDYLKDKIYETTGVRPGFKS